MNTPKLTRQSIRGWGNVQIERLQNATPEDKHEVYLEILKELGTINSLFYNRALSEVEDQAKQMLDIIDDDIGYIYLNSR